MQSLPLLAVLSALFILAQAQNNTDFVWVDSLIDQLNKKGIRESTAEGTSLGFLRCAGKPEDNIVYGILDNNYLAVNAVTGEVTVNGDLDREASSNSPDGGNHPYLVVFTCSVLVDGELTRTLESAVTIAVQDVNDETPTFSNPGGFTFTVAEDIQPKYLLNATITVSDRDKDSPNNNIERVEMYCEPPARQDHCDLFSVKKEMIESGKYRVSLFLVGKLDYETDPVYTPAIRAVDGSPTNPLTGSVGIRIVVLDSQDRAPRFQNLFKFFSVEEGVAVGTRLYFRLSAEDMDRTNPHSVVFDILSQKVTKPQEEGGVDLFRAGEATVDALGIYSCPIIVNVVIDREQTSDVYTFTAMATEVDSDGRRTNASVTDQFTVLILDVNDNAPLFKRDEYYVTIAEAEPYEDMSITVEDLEVDDKDTRRNARYRVEVVSQTYPGAFEVVPKLVVEGAQGFNLIVNNYQLVDYEENKYRSQRVVLRAREISTKEEFSSSATIFITVTDRNDNAPVFRQEFYYGSILEIALPGTTIVTLSATDIESGLNGEVFYRLAEQVEKFQVNSTTGLVTVAPGAQFNYEERRSYGFGVFAVDRGTPALSTQTVVVVRIIDYNEFSPVFTSTRYIGEVTDGSQQLIERVQVEAVDNTDPTANITYKIIAGNTPTNSFVLDPFTGELTLREVITYDMTPDLSGQFRLEIEATDNGEPPLTGYSYILIYVFAQNNNPPVFDPVTYTKTISETIDADKYLLTVFATDDDYGTNAAITYRIGTGGRDSFVVKDDGMVFTSLSPSLDYDLSPSLTVKVVATDGGSPQRSATATIFVTVTDSNNKDPVFRQRLYNKVIDESTRKGVTILTVEATDPDTNSSLRYSLDETSIRARDKFGFTVANSPLYPLASLFTVDAGSGDIAISLSGPGLDRNYVAEMTFSVKVTDINGVNQVDTTIVNIIITGRPDRNLYFAFPWTELNPVYTVQLSETTPIGGEVKILQARDPVDGEPVTTYRETGGDPDNYFILSDTIPGKVVLNKALDYDGSSKRTHSVVVAAIKNATEDIPPRSATVILIVHVQDANDNAPQFTQQVYNFEIREDKPVNTEVGEISVYDADSSTFGPFEFTLGIGQDRNHFRLDKTVLSDTVMLMVNKPLDFETRKVYKLEVIVKDNSREGKRTSLQQESRTEVTISLLDVNDNTPTFTDQRRAFSVAENADIGERLGQVLAQDDDSGIFGNIVYSLVLDGQPAAGVNPLNLFGIDKVSGVLFTKQSLRGLSNSFYLRVVARDQGTPSRSDSIPVVIKVQEVQDNDGTPTWVSPVRFVTYITEHNQTRLDVVLRAEPRLENASIEYSLVPSGIDYLKFDLQPGPNNTAYIDVIADLDREVQPTYEVLVEARDTLDPTKLSSRVLTIHLIDIDDNVPLFQKTQYAACPDDVDVPIIVDVLDETPKNTIVATAVACDPDAPPNDGMYYKRYVNNTICRENFNTALRVNENGTIQSTITLDYEVKVDYLVCVEVQPLLVTLGRRRKRDYDVNLMRPRDKVAYFIIRIIDTNDNGPVFPEDKYLGVLKAEPQPIEEGIIQVLAIDPDGPLNDRTNYTIRSIIYYPGYGGRPVPMRKVFSINPNNGMILTRLPVYKDFINGYFELEVQASDAKNGLFNTSTVVTLVVYQKSQILKVVLDQPANKGQRVAEQMIEALKREGARDGRNFFLIEASEHRTGSTIMLSRTDVCLVVVENNRALYVGEGIKLLTSGNYRDIMNDFKMVDMRICHQYKSSKDSVKWQDLWWVLVIIAIAIFVWALILIITICILYNSYKNYMKTERTYLVPH